MKAGCFFLLVCFCLHQSTLGQDTENVIQNPNIRQTQSNVIIPFSFLSTKTRNYNVLNSFSSVLVSNTSFLR